MMNGWWLESVSTSHQKREMQRTRNIVLTYRSAGSKATSQSIGASEVRE